jgi:hypothetical protein
MDTQPFRAGLTFGPGPPGRDEGKAVPPSWAFCYDMYSAVTSYSTPSLRD